MNARVQDYVTLFMELSEPGKKIQEAMFQAFTKYKKEFETSAGNTFGFGDIKQMDNSIELQFLDFKIRIEFKICASKEVGFIKWFKIYQDIASKPHKTLIIKDSFNKHGDIKTSWESNMGYSFKTSSVYFFQALMKFCENNDEMEFKKID